MVTVETRRLQLAALNPKQLRLVLTDLIALGQDLHCTILPEILTPAAHRATLIKLEKMSNQTPESVPWFTYWLLIQRKERLGIGMAGFKGKPGISGEAEIGYGIAESQHNRGYMTEAVNGLVGWAFGQAECSSVIAETHQSNIASRRVLEKAGFQIIRQDTHNVYWSIGRSSSSGRPGDS